MCHLIFDTNQLLKTVKIFHISRKVPIPGENRRRRRSTGEFVADGNRTLAAIDPILLYDESIDDDLANQSASLRPTQDEQKSRKVNNYYEYIYQIVNASTTTYVLNDLKHYSSYTLSLKACREGEGENCSNEVIVYQRTAKIGTRNNPQTNSTLNQQIQLFFFCLFVF